MTSSVQAVSVPQASAGVGGEPPLAAVVLAFLVASFVVLGLLIVPGSSITAEPTLRHQEYFFRQLTFATVGMLAAAIAARLPAGFWLKLAPVAYLVAVAGLVALLIPGMTREINGARRWFVVGPVTVQWSEFARIAAVLYAARRAARAGRAGRWRWRDTMGCLVPGLVASALVIAEPDFGGGLLIAVLTMAVSFLGGIPWSHLIVLSTVGGLGAVAALLSAPYRMARIAGFLQAWTDLQNAPYQVKQSILSFVSGGLWGTGLGAGWQKLGFLPEASTDYVFAVIGEELGLVGAVLVIAGWMAFVWAGWSLAERAGNRFAELAIRGLVFAVSLQAFIHIAVVLALLPPKGIGLPFVSYGGSNLTASLLAVGIVLGLGRSRPRAAQSWEVPART